VAVDGAVNDRPEWMDMVTMVTEAGSSANITDTEKSILGIKWNWKEGVPCESTSTQQFPWEASVITQRQT